MGCVSAGKALHLSHGFLYSRDLEHAIDGTVEEGIVHQNDAALAIAIEFFNDLLQGRVPENQKAPAPSGRDQRVSSDSCINSASRIRDLTTGLQFNRIGAPL